MRIGNDLPASDDRIGVIRRRDHEQCQNCHRIVSQVQALEVHQVVPEKHGGTDHLTNFQLLCAECHIAAHRVGENTEEASA